MSTTPIAIVRRLQIAALVIIAMSFASTARAATINCLSTTAGGDFCAASFSGSETFNEWFFYSDDDFTSEFLLYTFELFGPVSSDFEISVRDRVSDQETEQANFVNFPNSICIPTFSPGECAVFEVTEPDPSNGFTDNFTVVISWFTNANPLSSPESAYILEAHGDSTIYTEKLPTLFYDPFCDPGAFCDPVLGGDGDSFSVFAAATDNPVPEPGSMILVGTGMIGALVVRRARSKRQAR